jgi:hypothetical protein
MYKIQDALSAPAQSDLLLMNARAAYEAQLRGLDEPNFDEVGGLPVVDISEDGEWIASARLAELRVLGRFAAHVAGAVDDIESNSIIRRFLGRTELLATRIFHPQSTKILTSSGGIVDKIRNNA